MTAAVSRSRSRNSAIELLRLLAMLMIVGQHFVRGGEIGAFGEWIANQPVSFKKFVYQFVYMSGGWVGNCIFFTISVWFLVDKQQTLKGSFRRVWIMERELLFWSLSLLLVSFGLQHIGWIDRNMLSLTAASVLPLSLNLWWYATSYALFLIFLPFLIQGMKSLGERKHKALAIIVLILWGIFGLIPHIEWNLEKASVFVFIYWFILITYYKWYMTEMSKRQCYAFILLGVFINLLYWGVTNLIYIKTGKFASLQNYVFDHWFIASMMIGFGIFALAEKKSWNSPTVNFLAASSFGVYLIHTYWSIPAIWNRFASIRDAFLNQHAILFGICAIMGIFISCLFLDVFRQLLFRYTIDRHRGALFDRVWKYLSRRLFEVKVSGCAPVNENDE